MLAPVMIALRPSRRTSILVSPAQVVRVEFCDACREKARLGLRRK